ncbi:hypothetical protein MTR67_045254 [Solanum verrucosum]|uniref:Uncharacterized protein n=1 Tax=Solanum verrucosum TaxID=315347 RepID=A0AAF0UUX9_SOLVR|nr:hypothetical protein MTR67_045254 [Solanum verrucosum]
MRKVVIFPIKVCYRTVWNHPFLVGMLCFLAFLYKSFPFVFSILVSVSPILVCTTALLGTLLSYAQPNIPEFEWEENTTDHIMPLETRDVIPVESDNSYFTERYSDQERDKVDQSTRSEVHRGKRFGDHSALIGGVSGQVAREFYEHKNEDKFSDAELMENQYSPTSKVDDESVEFDNDKSVDSFDSRRVNLDSPLGSPWKHREEALYGSDGAESSSPDASIADIMPMLDELHPLLDEDNPQLVGLSHDVSHVHSESSTKSSESDDDVSEDQEEVEVADDEEEEEEETRDTEGLKSAITWTEEDQRNLMDLGTSELERNQRLESLIARRRSRNNMSFTDEKSLIDLVTADFMPPISTARQNPFDLPNDNYSPGLPPIPGSAPSILLPRCRRNPFDLPYDPSEEKSDLTGDTFEQEIITSQPKETFFRRHESFNVGPSIFGLNKKDTRFRPYFVPDVMAAEGTSYSPFQRQGHPNDLSDSKVSSVLETESQGSIEDLEYKNLTEEDVEDKNLNEELEDKNLTDEHIFKEPELISKIEHATEDIGHGSQSSEEVECLVLGASDKRDIELNDTDVKLVNMENHHEVVPIVFHEEKTVISMKLNPSKICSKSATSEQKCSSQSSSSSSLEVGERIFPDKVVVRLSSEEAMCHVETISKNPSPNMSDLNITRSSVEETSHLEPIYDASPPSIKKNTSSSSIASDLLLESETEMENNQDTEKSISQIFSSADSQELRLREAITDKNELHVAKLEISKHDEVFGSASAPPVLVADSQASSDSKSPTKEAPVSMEKERTTESLNMSKDQEVPPESFLKPSNAKMATEESESSKNGPVHKVSSLKDHEMGLPTLEPRPTRDIDLINKQTLEENVNRHVLHDSIDGDVHVRESKENEHSQDVGTDSAMKQVMKNDIDKPNTSLQQELKTESSLQKIVVSERSEADAGKIDQKVVKQEDKARKKTTQFRLKFKFQ